MAKRIVVLCCLLAFAAGCASVPAKGNKTPIPLREVNLEAVLQENTGLEMTVDDVKDVRDYYRVACQQKIKAERALRENSDSEALQHYRDSMQSFLKLLNYIDADSAKFNLFEETNILFFPNLLMADNHLKMGTILRKMNMNWQARHHWKMGLSAARDSFKSEPTEWALDVQRQLDSLLAGKSN